MQNIFYIFVVSLSLLSCSGIEEHSGCVKTDSTETCQNDSALTTLPEVLNGLPVGIEVSHDPDSIKAVVWEKDTTRYVWKHTTSIISKKGDLQIIEFGTYNFKNGKWELGNINKKIYGPEEMDQWYLRKNNDIITWEHPINGVIKKDALYIDPTNYSVKNKNLVSRNGLWYYIGVDSAGTKYMGYGRYVTLPELKKP